MGPARLGASNYHHHHGWTGDTVDYQLKKLLHTRNYYRFQTKLTNVSDALDKTDAANIKRLKEITEEMITEQNERIKKACSRLLENKKV